MGNWIEHGNGIVLVNLLLKIVIQSREEDEIDLLPENVR